MQRCNDCLRNTQRGTIVALIHRLAAVNRCLLAPSKASCSNHRGSQALQTLSRPHTQSTSPSLLNRRASIEHGARQIMVPGEIARSRGRRLLLDQQTRQVAPTRAKRLKEPQNRFCGNRVFKDKSGAGHNADGRCGSCCAEEVQQDAP